MLRAISHYAWGGGGEPRAIQFAILPVRFAPKQNRKFNGTSPCRFTTGNEASNADEAETHLGEVKQFAGKLPINGRDLSTVRLVRRAERPTASRTVNGSRHRLPPHAQWRKKAYRAAVLVGRASFPLLLSVAAGEVGEGGCGEEQCCAGGEGRSVAGAIEEQAAAEGSETD